MRHRPTRQGRAAACSVVCALLLCVVSAAGSRGEPQSASALPADLDMAVGRAVFRKNWVAAPASTDSSDGLGPLYNARSCVACHPADGARRWPALGRDGRPSDALVARLSVPPRSGDEAAALARHRIAALPEPVYGLTLQPRAIQGHVAEGRLVATFPEGRRRPVLGIAELAYGPLAPDVMISVRLAPRLAGLGLVEMVAEADIVAGAEAHGRDGIRGRPGYAWSAGDGRVRLARFGLKASKATLREQTGDALAIDMGLSNPLLDAASGDCTQMQPACRAAPSGASPRHGGYEVGETMLAALVAYVRSIAPPEARMPGSAARAGEGIFREIGCAACHRPSLPIRDAAQAISAEVPAFSDFLLHDMGEDLADGRPEGAASGRDWRTAPLWGIGALAAGGAAHVFLHDGRASSLADAILWHGGEALPARQRFEALAPAARAQLLAFLGSL